MIPWAATVRSTPLHGELARSSRPSPAGICYRSRLGDQFVNWAIFEPPPDTGLELSLRSSRKIDPDDPDLLEALRLLNLALT